MKSFTCTNINKSNENKIISYDLQDSTGKTLQISYNKLRLMLESSKIQVVNLTIKNNEIIEDPEYQLKSMIAKLKLLGGVKETTYKSACGHTYYVIENSDTTIVHIPDDVEYLIKSGDDYGKPDFCNINCKTLKVLGGSGLTSTLNMFYQCEAQSIDLSSFDTSKVTNMNGMFCGCKAQSLDLSSFNTSNVTDMNNMFSGCKAQSIDFSLFDTSNVTDMSYMFGGCEAHSIDLSSFDTSNVINMNHMFVYCKARSLDLSSFDTSKVTNMHQMFDCCKVRSLDISSFDTSNVTDMYGMFYACKAQVKATDSKILSKLSYLGIDYSNPRKTNTNLSDKIPYC